MRRRPTAAVASAVLLSAGALGAGALALVREAPAGAASTSPTPVNARQVIGYSVKHRPIVAYRLGDPQARVTAVLVGQMHGDEHAGVRVATSLVDGHAAVEGITLWVIPTMNPDGNARNTRGNLRHVDLNRNWPDHWAPLTGQYYSGPKPLSEPETRAMRRFLLDVRPHYLVVLHQPLYGVDTTDGGALDHAFRDRLARYLDLPLKAFRCWSFCHGSMTGWYTTHRYGIAETVEFGANPTASYLAGRAPRAIVNAMGGHFGRLVPHNPRSMLAGSSSPGQVQLHGWAYDVDAPAVSISYTAYRDGKAIRSGRADAPSPALDASRHITGAHSFAFTVAATPGEHAFCLQLHNLGSGTGDSRPCINVTVRAPPTPTPTPSSTA
jgi:protein MpaA